MKNEPKNCVMHASLRPLQNRTERPTVTQKLLTREERRKREKMIQCQEKNLKTIL